VVLSYSTYLGGSYDDVANAIAVDSSGSAYVTGYTYSGFFPDDFPTTDGAYQTTPPGLYDAFVTKFKSDGSSLSYSTYLGGSFEQQGLGIAVDSSGSAYVTGYTYSGDFPNDFPTTDGAYQTKPPGTYNAFVTKLQPDGSGLSYSTYLGGSFQQQGLAIAVDSSGSAYVTGYTYSDGGDTGNKPNDFPTTAGALKTASPALQYDAFVTKFTADGSGLAYSTYLGGSFDDVAAGIAVDASGSAYVTGYTYSNGGDTGDKPNDFPTTAGALKTASPALQYDAFVSKLTSDGTGLAYSTYLGGSFDEKAAAIAVDSSGSAYVTGYTYSNGGDTGDKPNDFPTTAGAYQTKSVAGQIDAFVTKFTPDGSGLLYSTYLGGSFDDSATGIAVDASGSAYVTGWTVSFDLPNDFPTTSDAYQTSAPGQLDGFLTKLAADGSALSYSTYFGGANDDVATAVALDPSGNVYIAGETASTDFPTTSGAYQTTAPPFLNAFVAKFSVS
jgi:hypothetical protein